MFLPQVCFRNCLYVFMCFILFGYVINVLPGAAFPCYKIFLYIINTFFQWLVSIKCWATSFRLLWNYIHSVGFWSFWFTDLFLLYYLVGCVFHSVCSVYVCAREVTVSSMCVCVCVCFVFFYVVWNVSSGLPTQFITSSNESAMISSRMLCFVCCWSK